MTAYSSNLRNRIGYALADRAAGDELLGAIEAASIVSAPGAEFYVNSNTGSSGNSGLNSTQPKATLAQALALCTANKGDVIYLMPGHTESLAAAVAISTAGVRIVGLGQGTNRPTFTVTGTVDGFNVTGANVLISNVYFNEATAAATASINVAAANCTISGCHFDLGANDAECITVADAGDGLAVYGCDFIVTANGPDAAIEIEAAGCDNIEIAYNLFHGGSSTNAFDAAAINSTVAHTNVRIFGNTFLYGTATVVATSVSTTLFNNEIGGGARLSANTPLTIYAADGASTTGQGSKEDPTTITEAITRATAAGDVVVLMPGTYTITAALALDVAGMTLMAESLGTVEIANDTDDIDSLSVTAAGVVVKNIKFTKGAANTTDGTPLIDVDASNFTLKNCILDLEARANADGVNLATGTVQHVIEDCLFTGSSDGKAYIASAAGESVIRRNHFDCSAADALCYEQAATPGDGVFIIDNNIIGDGADDPLMSWQSSPGKNIVARNYLAGTADTDVLGDDADNDLYIFGNYVAGTAGAIAAVNPSVS